MSWLELGSNTSNQIGNWVKSKEEATSNSGVVEWLDSVSKKWFLLTVGKETKSSSEASHEYSWLGEDSSNIWFVGFVRGSGEFI